MPMRALIVMSFVRSATPGVPRCTGKRHALAAHLGDPRDDRVGVEAHLRRHVRRVPLLLAQHLEQDVVARCRGGPPGSSAPRSSSNGWPSSCIARSRASPSWNSPGSLASPPTTNAFAEPGRAAPLEELAEVRAVADHVRRQVRHGVVTGRGQLLGELDRRLDAVARRRRDRDRRAGRQRLGRSPSAFFSGISSNFGAATSALQRGALLLGQLSRSSFAEPQRHLDPPSLTRTAGHDAVSARRP